MGKTVIIHDKQFKKYISSAKIRKAIDGIAKNINKDYKDKRPVFVSVLNGSFMFTSDLMKKIKVECEVTFIKVASYSGVKSTGKIHELIGLNENLRGRSVVILEDIVDSGNTISKVLEELTKQGPKSIEVVALFFKPDAFRGNHKPDYIGLEVPNDFIIGYGLDYNGLGRNLSDIYTLKS